MRKHNNLDHRSSMLHCVIANLVPHCASRFTANLALESGPHHEAQPSRSPELHVALRFVRNGFFPLGGMADEFLLAGDLEPRNSCGSPPFDESHQGLRGLRNACGLPPLGAPVRVTSEGLLPLEEPRARNSHGFRPMGGPWIAEFPRISTPGDPGC